MTTPTDDLAQALPDFAALTKMLGMPDATFEAWRDATADKHWKHFDLSALRIGYELGKAAHESRAQPHDLIKTGDSDAAAAICDANGDVVLAYCRRCKQGEGDLEETCPGPRAQPASVADDDIKRAADAMRRLEPQEREDYEQLAKCAAQAFGLLASAPQPPAKGEENATK